MSLKSSGINASSGSIHRVLFFFEILLEHPSVQANVRIMADQTITHFVHSMRVKTWTAWMT